MDKPMVSVLTTCYNQAALVGRAVDSVASQDYKNIQHIVVDDGSKDGVLNALRRFNGLQLHLRQHYGLMATYQYGFDHCKGKYIAVCDADDYWIDREKITKQVSYMEANPQCAICFTWAIVEDDLGMRYTDIPDVVDASYKELLRGRAPVYSPTVLIRADILHDAQADVCDAGLFIWDLPIYLYAAAKGKGIHYLPFESAVYRRHWESFSNTRSRLRRLRYVCSVLKIKLWFIRRHGISFKAAMWCIYRLMRDFYAIVFKRWYK